MRRIPVALLAVACGLWAAGSLPAQQPVEFGAEPTILEEDLGEDIQALLAEAQEVFGSADQPNSIPLFERIILLLQRHRDEGTLDEQGRGWLSLSLFRRAEARHNLLDEEGATADLTTLFTFDPGWEIPEGYEISRKLAQILAGVRDAETGVLDSLVEPVDAEIFLDDVPLGRSSGPQRVRAGEHVLRVQRPGFDAVEQPLTVPAGEVVPLELVLERTSAVVRLATQPAGVEVVLDGTVLAVSAAPEGAGEDGTSAPLVVDGLALGDQLLVLRKSGYRPVELRVSVAELADYSVEPVVLEPTRGTVVLSHLPAAARVLVDGEPPLTDASAGPRFELPPGAYQLRVEGGAAGLFEREFELADQQQLEIEVRLRPALILLGVLGGDRVAATGLEEALHGRLSGLSQWALLSESERGFDLLRRSGLDRERLRRLAGEDDASGPPDWPAVQESLDRELQGSAYLVAVLSDDLYASRADLWLWSAAPGPSRPARRQIALADAGELDRLAEALDGPLPLSRPWIGARFIDSAAGGAPVVLTLEPDGPAATAGLTVGAVVAAVDGREVAAAAQLVEAVAGLSAGSEVELRLAGGEEARRVSILVGDSPSVVSLDDPGSLDPALAARLGALEAAGEGAAPGWLLRLNRGVVLMRGGEWRRAAEALRGVEAPAGPGVGRATVDYLLGITLLEVDPAAYRETAEGLIRRAAEAGGRLEHHDGPPLAPRARARLEMLPPAE